VSESLSEFAKFVAAIIVFALVLGAFMALLVNMHKLSLIMNARVVADAIAGAISAVSCAPDYATYCYTVPSLAAYRVVIGGGSVLVVQADRSDAFGISPYPVPGVTPTELLVGKGGTSTIVIRKMRVGASEQVSVTAPLEFELKRCAEVM
jgi:hypothetical protein